MLIGGSGRYGHVAIRVLAAEYLHLRPLIALGPLDEGALEIAHQQLHALLQGLLEFRVLGLVFVQGRFAQAQLFANLPLGHRSSPSGYLFKVGQHMAVILAFSAFLRHANHLLLF